MNSSTALSWPDVQNITRGRRGKVRAPCPFCSHLRKKRCDKPFAIWLTEPGFAGYDCKHCGATGYVHSDTSSRVVDLADVRERRTEAERKKRKTDQRRTAEALEIWKECGPYLGSPAETFHRVTRKIGDWIDNFDFDGVLGFHPECPLNGSYVPCMVALVRNIKTNEPQAIHRTALKLERGKPPQRIERRSLGPTGGGAIQLSPDDEVATGLLIGEGIETVLSLSLRLQFKPVWSVIDKNGVKAFPALPGLEALTVAVDNDKDGGAQRSADEMAKRLSGEGIQIIRKRPVRHKDFNDILPGLK